MAQSTLATARLQSGSSRVPGLRVQQLNSSSLLSVKMPKINIHAADINPASAPVPKTIRDNTLDAATDFAYTAVNAALQFRDREDEYLATKAKIAYATDLNKLYVGYQDKDGNFIKGYSQLEGDQARVGYDAFKQTAEDLFRAKLKSLPPRIQQRTIIGMESVKNKFMTGATEHRVKELKRAEEAARQAELDIIKAEIVKRPSAIYEVDPVTKLNNKQKFFSKFYDKEKAKKAWYDLVQDVGEVIYLQSTTDGNITEGIDRATAFYDRIGKEELKASPKHMSAMLGNIKRWQNESVRAYNSTIQTQLMRERMIREENYRNTEAFLEQQRLNGKIIPKPILESMVVSGVADPKDVARYRGDVYGEYDKQADPTTIRNEMNLLLSTAPANFKDANGNDVRYHYKKVLGLSNDKQAQTMIEDYAKSLTDPNYQAKYKQGVDVIENWTLGTWKDAGLYTEEKEAVRNQAAMELHTLLKSGMPLQDALNQLEPRYNKVVVNYNRLPPLANGIKPVDAATALQQLAAYKKLYENKKITKEQFLLQVRLLKQYTSWFEYDAKRKASSNER